jgi:DNA primase
MRADEFVTKLKGVKPKGRGKWMACCPAHDDSDPSLAVSEARNGNVLLKCFSGCSALDITNALGLRLEDLFADAYEEPPMAFAKREIMRREKQAENIESIMIYVAVYSAQVKRGHKPTQAENAKFKRYLEIVRKENREDEVRQMITKIPYEKVFDFDKPSYRHLVDFLRSDAA